MVEPAAADSAGDEYMTMDAEQWLENDDTYENGDTLGVDSKGRERGTNSGEQKTQELQNQRVSTGRTLPNIPNLNTAQRHIQIQPDRYVTLRRPPVNANRGQGVTQPAQLGFFRYAMVFLVLQSILLWGVLLALSIHNNKLSMMYMNVTEKVKDQQEEKAALENELQTLKLFTRPVYQVSTYDDRSCLVGQDLFIQNSEVLEEYMKKNVFHLFLSRKNWTDKGCFTVNSWNCTLTADKNEDDGGSGHMSMTM